jgi:predicted ribosomally synthesized peptide with SipW-like signal peptide
VRVAQKRKEKWKMDKKILVSLILIGLLGAAAGIGTWAYFSSTRTMNLGFNTASLNLELGVDYDWGTVLGNMAPGEDREQIFRLTNTGTTSGSYSTLQISYEAPCLCVSDGATDWAEISIPVDIALKDINQLSFWEKIDLFGAKGWDVNVILGIDLDGDGVFEANLPAWHGIGGTMHQAVDLHGDTFAEMDGKLGPLTADLSWTEIDALATPRWWTPNKDGNGLSGSGSGFTVPPALYCTFADLLLRIGNPTWDTNIPNTNVKVKVIKLVIGGAGSWVDERAYVRDISLNGVLHPLPDIGEVITVKVWEWDGSSWILVHEGSTLKQWNGWTGCPHILAGHNGVGAVKITLHFIESAGNEYQHICGDIDFTFTLWQGP